MPQLCDIASDSSKTFACDHTLMTTYTFTGNMMQMDTSECSCTPGRTSAFPDDRAADRSQQGMLYSGIVLWSFDDECCCTVPMLHRIAALHLCLQENAVSGMQGRLSSAGSSFSGDIAGFSGASSPLGSYPSTPLKTPPRPAARSGLSRNSLSRTPSQVDFWTIMLHRFAFNKTLFKRQTSILTMDN